MNTGDKIERAVAAVAPDALGAMAFAVSFRHVQDVMHDHGADGWTSWALAIGVEALAITAVLELRRRRRLGQSPLPSVVVLLAGVALVVACNLEAATAPGWGTVVALLGPGLYLLAWSLVATRGGKSGSRLEQLTAEIATLTADRERLTTEVADARRQQEAHAAAVDQVQAERAEAVAAVAVAEEQRDNTLESLNAATEELSRVRVERDELASQLTAAQTAGKSGGKGAGRIAPLSGWTGDASAEELAVLAAVLESVQVRRTGKRLTYSMARDAMGVRYDVAKAAVEAAREGRGKDAVLAVSGSSDDDITDAEILPMPSQATPRELEPVRATAGTR